MPLEHRQQAPLDLPPEALLLGVLLGVVGERRGVKDAELLEPLGELGGRLGAAVVGHQVVGQAPFEHRLPKAVHTVFGVLDEVPLQVTGEARAVIEAAIEPGPLPTTRREKDRERPFVEIEMP